MWYGYGMDGEKTWGLLAFLITFGLKYFAPELTTRMNRLYGQISLLSQERSSPTCSAVLLKCRLEGPRLCVSLESIISIVESASTKTWRYTKASNLGWWGTAIHKTVQTSHRNVRISQKLTFANLRTTHSKPLPNEWVTGSGCYKASSSLYMVCVLVESRLRLLALYITWMGGGEPCIKQSITARTQGFWLQKGLREDARGISNLSLVCARGNCLTLCTSFERST